MNLAEEMTLVRERLSEPHRDDQTNAFIQDIEIVRWIGQGELQVMRDLVDDALFTVQKEATPSLSSGVAALPSDFMRLISLQVQAKTGAVYVEADLVSPKQARNMLESPQWRPTATRPFCYIFNSSIYVYPTTASAVKLRYVYRPTRRYRFFTGVHTGANSTTSIESSTMVTTVQDYWKNCEIVLNNGTSLGASSTVTGSTNASPPVLTVTAFAAQVLTGTSITLGEVSVLPPELYPLWIAWAAKLGFQKDRDFQNAQIEDELYQSSVKTINERYGGLHRAEPVKEMPR